MKRFGFFRTAKKFSQSLAAFALLALALSSCENFGGNVSANDLLFPVQGATEAPLAVSPTEPIAEPAAPAPGQAAVESQNGLTATLALVIPGTETRLDGVSKSALPEMSSVSANPAYTLSAVISSTSGESYSADGTYDSASVSWIFSFAGGKSESGAVYDLTVSLYYTDTSVTPEQKYLVANGSQEITVAAGAPSFSASVQLLPNAECSLNGSVELPLKITGGEATELSLQLYNSSGTDVTATCLQSAVLSLSASGEATVQSAAAGIAPGIYTLLMTFKNSGGHAVYSRTESLNVYPSLKTSAWWTSGAASSVLAVKSFDQTEFWVRGTGGKFYGEVYTAATAEAKDENNGSFAFPLKTIQAAVDKINAVGDTTSQYTIYIDGKVTGEADANYSAKNYALVNVTGERKILFKGWTGPDVDIIDVNKNGASAPTYGGRAFYIDSMAQADFENLCVTGGYAKGSSDIQACGGGLYLNGAKHKLKNVVISKNYAANRGGGVYLEQTKSATLDSCVVSENSVDTTGSPTSGIALAQKSGGGIFSIGDLTLKNTDIRKNAARDFGGGICAAGRTTASAFGVGCKLTMTGGIVGGSDANKNTCHKDGGGIFLEAGTDSIIDNAEISYNLAETKGYGGGISAQGKFTLKNSKILHNKAECGSAGSIGVGGGISLDGERENAANRFATIQSCEISDNEAENGGGGIRFSEYELELIDTLICRNDAGSNSSSCGGGLLIGLNASAPVQDESTSVKMTGGEISGNTAVKGGGVYVAAYKTSSSIYAPFVMGGAACVPAGDDGKNDVFLGAKTTIQVASSLTATSLPVATITPSSYSESVQVVKLAASSTATLALETPKFAVTQVPSTSAITWSVGDGGYLLKEVSEVFYISSDSTKAGDDASHDGSIDKPFATISYAASKFSDKTPALGGTTINPTFANKIFVLDEMTFDSGAGVTGACYFEVVGRAGGVAGTPVQINLNAPGTGFYVPSGQIVKFTNINITRTDAAYAVYAAFLADGGTLYMEDCSITGVRTKDCSAIATDGTNAGKVYLKNVSIKDNVVEEPNTGPWGPAVSIKSGELYISGKVEICDNTMKVSDGAGGYAYKEMNVWIGDNMGGSPIFHPINVVGLLSSGTSIGVTSYDSSAESEFTKDYKASGNALPPALYFTSDDGMLVGWNSSSDDAELLVPADLYVSGALASPAGSDATGNGTLDKPYASVSQAIMTIDGYGVATNEYTIHISGTIAGNVNIPDVSAAKITIAGTSAATDILDGVDYSASVVSVATAIPITLSKLSITRGTHGVYIDDNSLKAQVAIQNCVITDNQSAADTIKAGAGVYANMLAGSDAAASGTIAITDTQITSNKAATKGGGIHIESGVLSCQDCAINSNSALNGAGGGISADNDSKLKGFNVEGGQISFNTASTNGGGINIAAQSGASPLVKDVAMEGNKATGTGVNGNGGAVQLTTGKYLTIEDCDIKDNQAQNGAGVYGAGKLTIKGGTISGNTATNDGGGVCSNSSSSTLSVTDTVISANTAASNGGGVYSLNGFTMGGAVYIPAGADGKNDVYLATNALIKVASPLTATPTPVATITPMVYNSVTPVVALAASSTATLDDSIAKFAVTPNALSSWTVVKNLTGTAGVLRATNAASGGISVSISEGVAFVVTTPKESGQTASFVVQDTSGASPVAIAATNPYIAVKQNGVTLYSADAQSVDVPFISPGKYQLYCRATVDGAVFDTTVPFGAGDKYTPLTLEAAQAGAVVTFDNKASGPVTYRVNGGTEQTIASGASKDITLSAAGDKVQFYGDNEAYATGDSNYSNIACSADCYVYGNIMSLVKSAGFESETTLTESYAFASLFRTNERVKNKAGYELLLPATTLSDHCYYWMFGGCTSLTVAPELPATTLANYCYYNMFYCCTGLTTAPELPATTLGDGCYVFMFNCCINLMTAPELPATTLASDCYEGMFVGCISLATAPALPATSLTKYCYNGMFQGCTSLTAAPELPAETLTYGCYQYMFKDCTSLNSVTCLATDISATGCTNNWLDGVASSGTFTKAAGMTGWTSGAGGIPSGWTIQDAP